MITLLMVLGIIVQEVNNLENELAGEIKNTWVHLNTTDACNSMTPSCPVKSGVMVTYAYTAWISVMLTQR